ncbi:MAG: hypothetical protein PHW77_08615, partial [Eubacteriales bacterium]|nr:hypothetical protein [Eubacteriales bacterium]
YAWFTMNDRVNAGMDIEAVAAKNLVICETADGTYTTSVELSDAGVTKTLNPVSTSDCQSWFIPDGTDGISYETGAISDTTPFTALADTAGYVRAGTVYVKADMADGDSDFTTLYVSGITVTRGDDISDITKSLRVGVVCGANILIFDYESFDASRSTDAITAVEPGTGYAVTAPLASNAVGEDAELATTVGSTPVRIDIYLWYEGQDSDCTSHNSIKIENVEVSVEFKAER